ncbi:hypothetical protein [Actinomadura miaoliensis]|uniref:Uncharacterized protein n=1 Tax=Actinomadura miaoliensis TaxID=430685 RepID=A0ABP7W1C9_9ACTN
MTTRLDVRPRSVLSSRPRPAVRPVPSSSRPSSSRPSSPRSSVPSSGSSWAPVVEWDAVRGLHVARCVRCVEFFTSSRLDLVEDWATTHRCDAELAALLAHIAGGRAA